MSQKLTSYVHVFNDKTQQSVVLKPGDTVPSWAKDQVTNPKAFTSADEAATVPETPDDTSDGAGDFDPSEEGVGVDEVNNYLANADEDEVRRVLAAEAAGKNRKGIVEGPYAEDD